MSILNRISTILRANVNDLLDRAEDPEKALNQYVRDVGEAIREVRKQVAEAAAQARMTESDLRQSEQLVAQWQRKAQVAVAKGADDLARECLRRRHDYESNARVYQQQVVTQQEVADKLRRDLQLLESKYAEAERNRQLMLARYRGARAQEKIQKSIAAISLNDPGNALARMDERIRLAEARAAAAGELGTGSLEGRLASLDEVGADLDLEAELLELKTRADGPRLGPGSNPSH